MTIVLTALAVVCICVVAGFLLAAIDPGTQDGLQRTTRHSRPRHLARWLAVGGSVTRERR